MQIAFDVILTVMALINFFSISFHGNNIKKLAKGMVLECEKQDQINEKTADSIRDIENKFRKRFGDYPL